MATGLDGRDSCGRHLPDRSQHSVIELPDTSMIAGTTRPLLGPRAGTISRVCGQALLLTTVHPSTVPKRNVPFRNRSARSDKASAGLHATELSTGRYPTAVDIGGLLRHAAIVGAARNVGLSAATNRCRGGDVRDSQSSV